MIDTFQMIGDSFSVRLGSKILNNKVQHLQSRIGINFCVGGYKIENLVKMIDDNPQGLHSNIITWIGINNLLRGDKVEYVCDLYKTLLEKLVKLQKNILILAIPIIPKLFKLNVNHAKEVKDINNFLKGFDGLNKTKYLEINDLIMNNGECNVELFEKYIYLKGVSRPDYIHLNEKGLRLIYERCFDFIVQEKIRRKQVKSRLEVNHSTMLGSQDLRKELTDENSFNNTIANKIGAPLPELAIRIGNCPIKCLIDTRSQATIMSDDFYTNIKAQIGINIPELPVNNVSIMGVTGIKSKRVNKQVLLPCMIGNKLFDVPCFVVRNIPLTAILGSDFMEKYRAVIDYEKYTILLRDSTGDHEISLSKNDNDEEIGLCGIKIIYNNRVRLVPDDEQIAYIENKIIDCALSRPNITKDYQEISVKVNRTELVEHKLEEVRQDIREMEKAYVLRYINKDEVKGTYIVNKSNSRRLLKSRTVVPIPDSNQIPDSSSSNPGQFFKFCFSFILNTKYHITNGLLLCEGTTCFVPLNKCK